MGRLAFPPLLDKQFIICGAWLTIRLYLFRLLWIQINQYSIFKLLSIGNKFKPVDI